MTDEEDNSYEDLEAQKQQEQREAEQEIEHRID